MATPEFQNWGEWASPLFSTTNPDSSLNTELSSYFLEIESGGEKNRNPDKTPSNQVEIFESAFDLFKWPEPCVQRLKKFCMQGLWYAVAKSNGYSTAECQNLRVFVDSWFHVTHFAGYISYHSHPMASWSGVYMVDPGEADGKPEMGGVINFKDPRPHANMYLDPGNYRWARPQHMGSVNFPMKPGDLMLFPSFLQHEVTPYLGQKPRITVAFNCSFRRIKD
jgi:uncharacterized protein (TIGR02466 family)